MNRSQHKNNIKPRRLKLAAALLLTAALAGCRREQMGDGSYQKPFRPSEFFADHNSTRPQVEGTVARNGVESDAYQYDRTTMSVASDQAIGVAVDFPASFPKEGDALRRHLERGQERFNIYCAVCHGRTGAADGMIVQRGFIRPPAFYPIARDAGDADMARREKNLLSVPPGYIYDKITNGYGAMYSYAARVNPEDRWNIAAYVRVLQLSQNAKMADLSAADQETIKNMSTSGETKDTREPGGLGGAPGVKPVATTLPTIPTTTQAATQATSKPASEGQQ